MDDWLQTAAEKETGQNVWYRLPENSPAEKSGCERITFEAFKKIEDNGMPEIEYREVHFITEWTLFFNMMVEKNDRCIDYLEQEVPVLQLAWFFFYHNHVLFITKFLIVYLILCEICAFLLWPGYTLGNTASYCASYLAIYMTSVVMKGTGSATSVTSNHDDQKVVDNYNAMDNIKLNRKSDSLCLAFTQFFSASFQMLKHSGKFLRQKQKVTKSGAIQVNSFYYLMEAGTQYLITLK
mgnify:CR=1 FL=1